jgi:hypothetical protein
MLYVSKCQIAVSCQHVAAVEEGSCAAAVGYMCMAVDAATCTLRIRYWSLLNLPLTTCLLSIRSAESSLPEAKAHTLCDPPCTSAGLW